MTLGQLLYVLVPVLGGLTAHWWLYWIPLFRRARDAGAHIDAQRVSIPKAGTIKVFRKRNDQGDKIVLVHHMLPRLEDISNTLAIRLGLITGLVFVVAVFVALRTQADIAGPVVGVGRDTLDALAQSRDGAQAEHGQFLVRALILIGLPFSSLIGVIVGSLEVYVVHQELRKYRSILQDSEAHP